MSRPFIRCDWPGFVCPYEAVFFYRSIKETAKQLGMRVYIARCREHKPSRKDTLQEMPALYSRISRAVFVVQQVMES